MTIVTRVSALAAWSAMLPVIMSCGGGGSPPTSPSTVTATVVFSGSWYGTFGADAVPMSLDLSQNGSSVQGFAITGRVSPYSSHRISGTASGNTATVTIVLEGTGTAIGPTATFTVSNGNISTRWAGTGGATVTGTLTPATPAPAPNPPGSGAATITSTPGSVSMNASPGTCPSSNGCTVFQNISINSSTAWTSTVPGFGSLGEGFSVSPTTGPAGVTNVVVTYRWTIPTPSNGFFRFRTTTSGVYVEVPVVVNVR